MAVPYYTWQDTRKHKGNGLWYGRTTHFGIVDLDDLAQEVEQNCSLKRSDCYAVNKELLEVIAYGLTNGKCVYLDGFGYFKTGLTSKGSLSEDKFDVTEYVKGIRVNFQPIHRKIASMKSGGKMGKSLVGDIEFLKVAGPLWKKKKKDEEGNGNGNG